MRPSTSVEPALSEAFAFPQAPTTPPDETLLFDAERYDRHKQAQLFRPPAVQASGSSRIQLPTAPLPQGMAERRSCRRFSSGPVSWESMGSMLGAFRHARAGEGIQALYPSAGGLYGLDFYLHVKAGRVERLPGGIYYYHPASHCLHRAGDEAALTKDLHHHNNRPVFAGSAFTLIMVFDPATTGPVYGASSLALATLEAGLALGGFIRLAEAEQVGTCPIGLVDFPAIATGLQLRPGHAVIHVAECGPKPHLEDKEAPRPDAGPDLTVSGLRQFLAETLPDYMVPSHFVLIEEVPLTPNNKVDREALLKLDSPATLELGTAFAAAESDIETRMLGIWQQVLKREQIGVEDNFFDLGGDSMGVAEIHARIQREWQRDVPIVKLFQFPTIRASARYLRTQAAGASAPEIEAGESTPAPPAMAAADRDALAWIRSHPDDHRVPAIAAKLRSRNIAV